MKDWIQRHVLLTREERLLVAGIIVIMLIGLWVKYNRSSDQHPATSTIETSTSSPSR